MYLIRKSALGDVLWIEPLIRDLAKTHRRLIVYTKYNQLFENYPFQNVIFKSRLNLLEKVLVRLESVLGTRFLSINLDMSYEKAPKQHILKAYYHKAGIPFRTEYPKIYLNSSEKQPLPETGANYAVLHLESFSSKNYRQVYGIDWNRISFYLDSIGYKVILIGKNPPKIDHAISLKTEIREMIRVIHCASIFIGLDSGPSHIAAALKRPSILFFGAVNPWYRHFKEQFNGLILQQSCEFAGCYHEGIGTIGPACRIVGDQGIPPCSTHETGDVIAAIQKILENEPTETHTKG